MTFAAGNVMDDYRAGKIFLRQIPSKQGIEDWNDAWSEFKAL